MNRRRMASMLRAGKNFITQQPFTQQVAPPAHPRHERRQKSVSARQQRIRKRNVRWMRLAMADYRRQEHVYPEMPKHEVMLRIGKWISRRVYGVGN